MSQEIGLDTEPPPAHGRRRVGEAELIDDGTRWQSAKAACKATRRSRASAHGGTCAFLGLMAGVLVQLADAAFTDRLTVAVELAAVAVLIGLPINCVWLVAAGCAIGAGHAMIS